MLVWAFFPHQLWFVSRQNLWIHGWNSTDSWRTTRYDDGQSPRNKASKIQKLAFRCFSSADISKSEEISRWRPIDKAIHCNFSATKTLFGKPHICLQENKMLFRFRYSSWSETHASSILSSNRQTHRFHRRLQTRACPGNARADFSDRNVLFWSIIIILIITYADNE